jgi:hypothetical protein
VVGAVLLVALAVSLSVRTGAWHPVFS